MSYHVLYESCGWHTRCALFDEHGRLLTLRFDDISRRHIEGAVVWGRVRQVVPSLGAAFVDIGDTHDGVLNLKHLPNGVPTLTTGQKLLVRITRGGFGEKGANLDARVAYKPASATAPKDNIELKAPSALQRSLRDAGSMPVKVWLPHGVFRDAVAKVVPERQIFMLNEDRAGPNGAPDFLGLLDDELARIGMAVPTFPFSNGDVVVELTSAVATMDINFRPLEGVSKGDAVLAANLTAAETVARLVRLLDLGGSVIIDFITPKNKAQREMIFDHLDAALSTTDALLMRLTDVMLTFPTIFLILAVIAILKPSLLNVMIIIGLTSWMGVARLVRAEALSLKSRPYIQSATLGGTRPIRMAWRHVLPNLLPPIATSASLGLAAAILTEAGLSYLGLGVQPPTPSWGAMLTEGKSVMEVAWWLTALPGVAILLTVLGFTLAVEK